MVRCKSALLFNTVANSLTFCINSLPPNPLSFGSRNTNVFNSVPSLTVLVNHSLSTAPLRPLILLVPNFIVLAMGIKATSKTPSITKLSKIIATSFKVSSSRLGKTDFTLSGVTKRLLSPSVVTIACAIAAPIEPPA